MARMPGATWRPVPNCTPRGQVAVQGVVLHVMAGTLDGTDSWFHNSAAQASAHFGIGRDGRIFQWVDTADRAWAQMSGNRSWLSIEHEGQSGDSLTPAQLAASARVIRWMHETHAVPLAATDSPNGRGIGWHGMGGAAWGGHTACPGTPIKNQRAALIAAAEEEDMALSADDKKWLSDEIAKQIKAALPAIAAAVAHTDGLYKAPEDRADKDNTTWSLESLVTDIDGKVRGLAAKNGS